MKHRDTIDKAIADAIDPISAGKKRKPYTIMQKNPINGKVTLLLLSCDTLSETKEVIKDLNYAFAPKRYFFSKTKDNKAMLKEHNIKLNRSIVWKSVCCGAMPIGYYPDSDFCSKCKDHSEFYEEK